MIHGTSQEEICISSNYCTRLGLMYSTLQWIEHIHVTPIPRESLGKENVALEAVPASCERACPARGWKALLVHDTAYQRILPAVKPAS
jgi:hypothetical protein